MNRFLSIIIIFGITEFAKSAYIECLFNYDCCIKVTKISSVTQPNEAVTIPGKYMEYVSKDTTSMTLSDFVLKYIPSGIFTVFPNLISFMMNKCQTTILVANTNWNCGKLQNFYIANGIILNIPEGFIQSCLQLTSLYLSDNKIETVDKNAFRGLTKLTTLELSNNNLACLLPDLFQNLPNLENIYLNDNKIKIVNSGTFRNLPSLMFVNFAYNLLKYLPSFDLNGTSTQTPSSISFASNPINAISPDLTAVYPKRGSLPAIQFNIGNISCLNSQLNNGFYIIDSNNYKNVGSDLQKCYQDWRFYMTDNILCEQKASSCPMAAFWPQILDYLKSIKAI